MKVAKKSNQMQEHFFTALQVSVKELQWTGKGLYNRDLKGV